MLRMRSRLYSTAKLTKVKTDVVESKLWCVIRVVIFSSLLLANRVPCGRVILSLDICTS